MLLILESTVIPYSNEKKYLLTPGKLEDIKAGDVLCLTVTPVLRTGIACIGAVLGMKGIRALGRKLVLDIALFIGGLPRLLPI